MTLEDLSIMPKGTKLIKVGGIHTAITEEHNEVFYFWQMSHMKSATLLHVDAHHDMDGVVSIIGDGLLHDPSNINYFKSLYVGNFICPAVHYGIVSDVYWLNPHSNKFFELVEHSNFLV